MKSFIYILLFTGWCLGATTISTTYKSGSCPALKHSSCLSTTVSGSYNWKTKRGKITISGKFPVFEADYIIMVGYDADGIELGEIYHFTPDYHCDNESECGGIFIGSVSFTEYNNGLPESLQSEVRSIKLHSNGNTKRIICNDGYYMDEDDGICRKDNSLPDNCWGDPLGDHWCV